MATVSRFASELEQDEQNIYRDLAERAQMPGIRRIFSEMVVDEKRIIGEISHLCDSGNEPACINSEDLVRPENLTLDQINTQEVMQQIENDVDAYRFILKLENEVEGVYERMAARIRNQKVRQAIKRVIAIKRKEMEEMENVLLFADAPNQYLEWGEFSNPEAFCNFGRCVDD